MNNFSFTFRDLDTDESIKNWSGVFGSTTSKGTTHIPSQLGTGTISRLKLEKGLSMRIWDMKMNNPILFKKNADSVTFEKTFQLVYLANPETISLKEPVTGRFLRLQNGINILFSSSDNTVEMNACAGKDLRGIDIIFTASWLRNAYEFASDPMKIFLQDLLQRTSPTVLFESISTAGYKTLLNILACGKANAKDALQLKADLLSLLAAFFHTVSGKPLAEHLIKKHPRYDKMLEVEQLLKDHLQKKLPGIEKIARQLALSESTLKRCFFLSFGKSIYDYYLELKMDMAKRMMMEKKLNVNQVANRLDYEKVSNFISMFKKHHGFSPGEMRKQNLFG